MKIYLKITIFPKYIFAFGKWFFFFFIYLQHLYLQQGRMDMNVTTGIFVLRIVGEINVSSGYQLVSGQRALA